MGVRRRSLRRHGPGWGAPSGHSSEEPPQLGDQSPGTQVGSRHPGTADERGNRPSNNAPDELHLDRQNPDGSPDYHGWPDRYGGLPTSQAVYDPIGGPNDDVCPPPFSQVTCLASLQAANDIPGAALARLGFELRWITRLRDTAKNLGIASPA